jgi:hypothetical protein
VAKHGDLDVLGVLASQPPEQHAEEWARGCWMAPPPSRSTRSSNWFPPPPRVVNRRIWQPRYARRDIVENCG